jgi:hypothetical protein
MSSLLASTQKTYPASLLLNFEGNNNSTTFTDSSIYNHTGTAYGNAIISTSQSKFGGSSGYFDGTGDYVQYPANSSFSFGTDPFTIDFWVRFSSIPSNGYAYSIVGTCNSISSADNSHWWIGLDYRQDGPFGAPMRLIIARHGDYNIIAGTAWTPSLNTWYNIAITKNNDNIILIYIDGVLQYTRSTNNWSSANFSGSGPLNVGSVIADYDFHGHIDSLRIVKGISLYNSTAIPISSIPFSKNATIPPKLFNHIIMTSTKSNGDITGYVSTDTGYYTVNWWDGTKTTYSSDVNFTKTAVSGSKDITIYPSTSSGVLSGNFSSVIISNNNLTSVRAFYSKFIQIPGVQYPGYNNTWYYWYNYPYTGWNRTYYVPGAYIPGAKYLLDVSANNLDSSALNQLYSDLLSGNGTIEVSDNPGCDSDNTALATNKGYTVFGSISATTDLLLNLNGSNGSTTFTDSSANSRSITVQTGSPSLNTTTKKYGTASLSINSGSIGNDSYIIPDLSNMDWSIEFWIYRPTATAAYEGLVYLASSEGVDSSTGVSIHLYTNNDIHFNDNGQVAILGNTNVTSGVWHHVACIQDSKYKKLFFNGILMGVSEQDTPPGPYQIRIGRSYGFWQNSPSSAYIDDFKITRGKCAYYQDFVPPTGQLTSTTTTATIGSTVLLLKGNGTNGSTTFTDDGHKALTPTRNGNTIISTAQYKYGTASIYFDGTGDYLSYITGKDNFNLFNSNFTIECWIRMNNTTGTQSIFSKRTNTVTYGGLVFAIISGKPTCSATSNGSSWAVDFNTGSTTLSTNTWYHIALTRLYNTFRIFVDGIERGSFTVSDFIITGNSDNMVIGAGGATGGQEFNGYIDDLRIIRGVSLYNNNFTPPTSELGIYP